MSTKFDKLVEEGKRLSEHPMVKKGLEGFTVEVWYRVFETDEDGRDRGGGTVGVVKDVALAGALLAQGGDYAAAKVLTVLTNNGDRGIPLHLENKIIDLSPEDTSRAKAVQEALAKLTPAEQKLLNLEIPEDKVEEEEE